MKWSELPEVYRNLDLGDVKETLYSYNGEVYDKEFRWSDTIQGYNFWNDCFNAIDESELPTINPEWTKRPKTTPDPVNHPSHYGGENNPYEAIKIIEAHNLGFHLGNAVKYILRAGKKGDASEDIKKAIWYLQRELKKSNQ
jgi:hypothetical protein